MCIYKNIKKLRPATLTNASTCKQHIGQQLFRLVVYDATSKRKFLIDSGADISVIPPAYSDRFSASKTTLYAANGRRIKTFGKIRLTVDLGLRRAFTRTFIVAEVTTPIIGADFIRHFGIVIDLKRNRLIDTTTQIAASTTGILANEVTIKAFNINCPFAHILAEFEEFFHANKQPVKSATESTTTHHIETKGPPVFARPRRLDAEKLKAARAEFRYLMERGICRPSKSNWASPLHMSKRHYRTR